MSKDKSSLIDIEVDKLTNSIENCISGDSFDTEVLPFSPNERGYKKSHWRFDWKLESKQNRS